MAGIGTDGRLKVAPEQLSAKSVEIKRKTDLIRREFASLESRMEKTTSYWNGEANDTYRAKYKEFKDVTEEIIKRLEEHVRDLNMMAGVYSNTEKNIENTIENLPTDIIS